MTDRMLLKLPSVEPLSGLSKTGLSLRGAPSLQSSVRTGNELPLLKTELLPETARQLSDISPQVIVSPWTKPEILGTYSLKGGFIGSLPRCQPYGKRQFSFVRDKPNISGFSNSAATCAASANQGEKAVALPAATPRLSAFEASFVRT